ncbi:MAG: oxygen-independent coproporphyrinogen III oxidase [Rhodospirillaceae bacterium]|nr:oxygen-independent coproporphyrinogen III oxidase [Rhodospirillaceae bacterium]
MREDILRRYEGQRVPRYTSYPTAPHFTAAVDAAAYRAWLAAVPETTVLSVYLHVPFCTTLCWYCGCHTKITARYGPVGEYLERLEREIDLVAGLLPRRMAVGRIHWGGGTPTIAGPAAFGQIMDRLRARFDVVPQAEVAVEADPRRLEPSMIEALVRAGVGRVSLGVQTLDPAVQAAINRIQPLEVVRRAVEGLRAAGIGRLNFDLLYGLPGQTVDCCVRTAEQAAALAPDRLAVFGYAHVPWMKTHQRLIDEAALPGAAARLAQFDAIAATLAAAGYRAVGLDHFARPDDALARALDAHRLRRNFQGYTDDDCGALIGFGASAIGTLPQGHVQNAPSLNAYARQIDAGGPATARGMALGPDDRLRGAVIEEIMCYQSVDLGAVACRHGRTAAAFGRERAALAGLAAEGIVTLEGDRVTVAPPFRPLMRSVAAVFDAYLEAGGGRYAQAV